jgi:hypothetical protein
MWRLSVAAVVVGSLSGAGVWWTLSQPQLSILSGSSEPETVAQAGVLPVAQGYPAAQLYSSSPTLLQPAGGLPQAPAVNNTAVRYARAMQNGDCDTVLRSTWWMEERLQRVQLESADESALLAVRDGLCASVQERRIEGRHLQAEGVADQYLFTSGATLEVLSIEDSDAGLNRPVKDCTWIRVTYPSRTRALRDEMSRPIKHITVGVHVSTDGYVLKADVAGNVELDYESIVLFDADTKENTDGAYHLSSL